MNFEFTKRNTAHWDVWADKERVFRIRGKGSEGTDKGNFCVIGEHSFRGVEAKGFATLSSATLWITDKLMSV